MSDIAFRYADRADAPRIVELIETAYRGPDQTPRWDSEAHLLRGPRTSRAEIEGLLADPDTRFVLAERDGTALACALIQKHGTTTATGREPARGPAYFGMFAVDESVRNIGLGKALLAECEARVQSLWGSSSMLMTVISVRKTLMDWYRRRGYAPTGGRLPFPFSETSGETTRDFDLIEMRKDLR
jgi:ribosomal protein S18 acetylase RimI-like enzyme